MAAGKQTLEWLHEHDINEDEDLLTKEEVGFHTEDEDQKREIFIDNQLRNARANKVHEIIKVAVSMKALYVLTSDQEVLRWNCEDDDRFKNPKKEKMTELQFGADDKILENIFCDRTGWHCLVTMQEKSTYYVHLSTSRPYILHKLNNFNILSVGWSPMALQYRTEEVLVGTDKGVIIAMNIEYDPSAVSGSAVKQPLFAKVFDLHDVPPIHGIQYEMFPGPPQRYLVLVATTTNLYQFVGDAGDQRKPDFQRLFDRYRMNEHLLQTASHEVPGDLRISQLQLYSEKGLRMDSFAWLAGAGLMHSKLASSGDDMYIKQLSTLPYPPRNKEEKPVGVGLTAYHLYLLFSDCLQVYSKLNQRLVHTHSFEIRAGLDMKGLVFDPNSESFFAWNSRFINQIVIDNEKRDVWKYYLEEKKYEEAVRFCITHESPALAKVRGVYGDALFSKKRYLEAAEAYALSNRTFEEVVLRIMSESAPEALQRFLELKLDSLNAGMKAQRTLISTWLVELHLNKLNLMYLREEKALVEAKEVFARFLDRYKFDLDAMTTYTLLQSHGRVDEWVYFAELKGKDEMVMLHYINQQQFSKALVKLMKIDPSSQESHLYRYAHIFLKKSPHQTVDLMIKLATTNFNTFEFSKILPALMGIEKEHRHEALRFEKTCVEDLKHQDRALHNTYLFHLAQERKQQQLLDYLFGQVVSHKKCDFDFDPEYAISVFRDYDQIEAQICVFSMIKQYSDAVELALEANKYDLAKENAGKPQEEDEELARKLWLKIALKYLEQKNVAEALQVMRDSKLIKMEDLLPHFNEEVSIENFKADICDALQDYKSKIEEYKSELDDSKNSAGFVKAELKEIRQRYIQLDGLQACELCNKPVMKRHFYLFPCCHAYHKDCLLENLLTVYTLKDKIRARKVKQVVDELQELEGRVAIVTSSRPSRVREPQAPPPDPNRIAELQRTIDDLLEKQCYLCGDLFIESITEDMTESEYEKESWTISSQ